MSRLDGELKLVTYTY